MRAQQGTARAQVGAHRLRRVAQTPRAFRNWPVVLRDLALAQAGRGPQNVEFAGRDGTVLRVPNAPGARVPVYEVLAEDCYRLADLLGPLRGTGARVLDVGAHVGAFACRLAAYDPTVTVRCLEPSPSTAEVLRANVARNGLLGRVEVEQAAVAGRAGEVLLADNGQASALNGLVAEGGTGVRVPATTLDDLVAAHGPYDVVKIDCEGAEHEIVAASGDAAWATVQRVVLEHHPVPGCTYEALRARLAAAGLREVRLEPVAPGQGTAWYARG